MKAEYKLIFLVLLGFLAGVSAVEVTAQFEDSSSSGNGSIQANMDEVNEATRYMFDMGGFATGCGSAMSDPDLRNRATTECMEVIRDFNSNMSQLWDEHRDTIDYYRA